MLVFMKCNLYKTTVTSNWECPAKVLLNFPDVDNRHSSVRFDIAVTFLI